jgi:mRNA interferase MazF
MSFEFGDVVLVPLPFISHRASKKRPAVVVSSRAYNVSRPDVIIIAVTSQLRPNRGLGDVGIERWQVAGLLKSSASRLSSDR